MYVCVSARACVCVCVCVMDNWTSDSRANSVYVFAPLLHHGPGSTRDQSTLLATQTWGEDVY